MASTSSRSGAASEKRRSPDVADDSHSQPLSKSPRLQLQEVAVQTEVWQPTRRSRPISRGVTIGKSEGVARRTTSEEPRSSQAVDRTSKRRAKSEEKKKSAEDMERGCVLHIHTILFGVCSSLQQPGTDVTINKSFRNFVAECREEQRRRRMVEKPWRANMKKAVRKREGHEEKTEEKPGGERDGGEEDELAKRPWRNNMRETATTRCDEGK